MYMDYLQPIIVGKRFYKKTISFKNTGTNKPAISQIHLSSVL